MSGPPIVLFDLDGTLTDPRVGITLSMQHALASVGVTVDDPDSLVWCIGPPLHENMVQLGLVGEQVDAAVAAYRARYDDLGAFENVVYPGVADLLDALVADGRTLGLATSKNEPSATRILEHFGLAPWFSAVAGASLDASRVTKSAVVARALGQLGRPDPATVVLVGDRRHDVEGARTHGLASVGVTWGYGLPGELEAAAPDVIVGSVAELAATLGV